MKTEKDDAIILSSPSEKATQEAFTALLKQTPLPGDELMPNMGLYVDAFGLHEAVNEVPDLRNTYHGLPDRFCVWYGTVHDIRAKIGLDPVGIRAAVQARLAAL